VLSPVKEIGEASSPPEGFDASALLQAGPWGLGQPAERARVAFSPKVAWWAFRDVPGARVVKTRKDGWVEVDVPASQSDSFVSWVLSFGPDARAYAPRRLRDQVVSRLEALAADG
jgi:predicted DNA-binding transcriptional regulator YafY